MNKKEYNYFHKKDGFTYVELLIVVGIMIIFGVFFVMAVDPVGKIKAQRDSQRESDINSVLLSVEQKIRNDRGWDCLFGPLPQDKFTAIGTGPGEYDLYSCLMPNYLSKYLVDPKEGSITGRNITDGLVGHWKFDEGSGTIAYDASGNDNHGMLINSPEWVDGKMGGALEFDGSSNYVDCGNNASLSALSKLTVEAFFKPNTVSPLYQQIVGKQGFLNEYRIILYENDIVSQIYDTTHEYSVRSSNGGVYAEAGVWYHAVMTYDGANLKLYINGTLVDTLSLAITINPNYLPLNIGRNNSNVFYFNGQIDDLRIYNRALSPEEIQDLYNYEYSSKYAIWQNPVTKNVSLKSLENETKEVSTGAPEVALDFDGVDDYVDCGNDESLDITDEITFGAWVKPYIYGQSDYHIVLESKTDYGWFFGTNGGKVAWLIGRSTSGGWNIVYTTGTLIDGWNHIVGTYESSSGVAKIYLNGSYVGSKSGVAEPTKSPGGFKIGLQGINNYTFNGLIDDVRIYDRALSAEEVKQLYKGCDIRNGLVGHWPLNEGQCTIAYDRSGNGNDGILLPAIDGPTWTTK